MKSRSAADVLKRHSLHNLCCNVNHRDSRHLADIRHRSRRARINLDNIKLIVRNKVLNVYKPSCFQRKRKLDGAVNNFFKHFVVHIERRINRNRIAAVNAGALDVLHYSRNENIASVTDNVNLKLFSHHIFINKHRVIDFLRKDYFHIARNIVGRICNRHVLTADNV